MKIGCQVLLLLFAFCRSAEAQGFINLNFESANVSGYAVGSLVPTNAALPGWIAFFGSNESSVVAYDGISAGGAVISVVDSNAAQYGYAPLQGKYSAALFGQGLTSPEISVAISQTGLVPSGTMSLQVEMAWLFAAPVVTLGGQAITMVPLQTFSNYTLYGGDISSFAGQVATLSFTEPPPPIGTPSSVLLDGIAFSSQPIPEPGQWTLLGVGSLLLAWCRLRKRNPH